jgi:formylglycine-generating enzyme required for sulfatase activity
MKFIRSSFCFFVTSIVFAPVVSRAALSLSLSLVGDPGNANDSTGFGGVSYTYAIGTTEVTINQYATFLNSVAKTDDFGLWENYMGINVQMQGITRSGSSGSYSYLVVGDGNRPMAAITWFRAARFTNWLQNGQPNTGVETAATTEDGVYTLLGATSGVSISKNAGALYWIPSENEWYKAAYYQPAAKGGDTDGYWLYPMKTNSVPYSDQPPGTTPDNTRVGNFQKDDATANGYDDGFAVTGSTNFPSSNALTDVGAYTQSASYYGTYDQGGDVQEWTDAVSGSSRIMRGGSWSSSETALRSTARSALDPTSVSSGYGFRIASIPEPSSALLLVGGGLLFCTRRPRR